MEFGFYKSIDSGVEPDDCFYIENEAAVRNKAKIDLQIDPPPDLAIEIDITSRTRFNNYQRLGVPELWRWNGQNLEINILINNKYVQSDNSKIFFNLPVADVIPQYLARSKAVGKNTAMRAFRSWIREKLTKLADD